MHEITFAYLVSPVDLHCIVDTFFLLFFFYFLFFIFYFLFFACTKNTKTQIANKLLFPLQMFFNRIFYFLFAYLRFRVFAWLSFCAFWCFLCFWWFLVLSVVFGAFQCFLCFFVLFGEFWCVQNLFVKKKKEFKTALITSFILLLVLDIDDKQEFSKPRKFAFIPFFFQNPQHLPGCIKLISNKEVVQKTLGAKSYYVPKIFRLPTFSPFGHQTINRPAAFSYSFA